MREREKKCVYFLAFLIVFFLPFAVFGTQVNLIDEAGNDSGWAVDIYNADVGNRVYEPVTFDVNFDEDYVLIQIDKKFSGTVPTDRYNTIVLGFTKTSENAVGTIIINDEKVTNNTDKNWTDYHMELLGPLSEKVAWFDDTTTPGGGNFANVSFAKYDEPSHTKPTALNFSGADPQHGKSGVVLIGSQFNPGFNGETGEPIFIQVDTSQITVNDTDAFLFKQWPSVPEPVTLFTLFLGGLGLIRWKK